MVKAMTEFGIEHIEGIELLARTLKDCQERSKNDHRSLRAFTCRKICGVYCKGECSGRDAEIAWDKLGLNTK